MAHCYEAAVLIVTFLRATLKFPATRSEPGARRTVHLTESTELRVCVDYR